MTPTPNMRELAAFTGRYLQGKDQVTVDVIARAFGIDSKDLKASWRGVIVAEIEGRRWVQGARSTGLWVQP
jgi:hypothetical protein